MKKILIVLTFLVFAFSLFLFSRYVSAGTWKSCCGSCTYTWSNTGHTFDSTTYYCCYAKNGWSTSQTCSDKDGGKNYKTYGEVEDCSGIYKDSCSGDTLTEYYCSGNVHASTTKNCNDYDCTTGLASTCSISSDGSTLTRSGDDYGCSSGACAKVGTKTCESYTCSASNVGSSQTCAGATYYCCNVDGNYKWQTSTCDATPPTTTINPNGKGWTSSDVSFTLTCSDDSSGCAETKYSIIDSSTSCPSYSSLSNTGTSGTVSCASGSACQKVVCYASKDKAGNIESVHKSSVFKIDKKNPTGSVSHSPTSPTDQDQVTYTATGSDSDSGLNKIEIYVDSSLKKTCTSSPCSYTEGPYSAGTTHRYYAKIYDNVGNVYTTDTGTFSVSSVACSSNADCDDSNPCTTDTCVNPGTTSSYCKHTNVADGTSCTSDGNPCTKDYCSSGKCIHPNKPDGTDCGDCKVCSSGSCVDKTPKPTCTECQSGPYCNAQTDEWYCTNKALCTQCSSGYCDGSGNCVANPCGTCKYCSSGSCTNRPDGYNDCGPGCQRCVSGTCQDYNPACSGTASSCYCQNDQCVSCSASGCCDATCNNYQCSSTPDNANCPSGQYCDSDCTCKYSCSVGSVCKTDPWSCKGSCERTRAVYVYDSSCNCVYNHNETEYAPKGEHCSNGAWTASGYCGSSSKYCSNDRYVKIDRYECNGAGSCNYYDYTDTLSDCGSTYYNCKNSCTKTYHYTCSNGACGSYSKNYYCPQDTACSNGACSASTTCSVSSYQCKDSCTKGQKEYRCDGSGNCNRFWQWINTKSCNPFSCSGGSCSNICSSTCGADAACDGKHVGDSCGTGKTCDSNCECVSTSSICNKHTDTASCNADPNCAWCSGDNKCKAASSVVCQPPSCSADKHSKCGSNCAWVDCGSTDNSCYCSNGQCVSCSGNTPKCNNYQCGCWQDNDCPYCYQKCDLSTNKCYDFRPQLTNTCRYYDACTSSNCATNPDYCYNADASKCADANWRCHDWLTSC